MEDLDPTGLAPFIAQLAKAADLCLKPYRHGVRLHGPPLNRWLIAAIAAS